jgi:hypothetical protein
MVTSDLNHSRDSPSPFMLKMKSGKHPMNWPRKTVLLLMTLLMFWAAVPSVACAFSAKQVNQPECCRNMATDCTRTMSADRPCCELSPQRSSVEVVPPFSPEQAHQFFVAAHSAFFQLAFNNQVTLVGALNHPVPNASPGSSTILRI